MSASSWPKTALAVAAALLLVIGLWLFRLGPKVEVVIPPGQSASQTARQLKDLGVISSPALFRFFAKSTGLHRDIKPGTFALRRHMSSLEALWRLTRDHAEYVRVVIPEGFSARQIAERLEGNGVTPAKGFLEHVRKGRLEGYLFPTTYHFSRAMAAEQAALMMHAEFKKAMGPELAKAPSGALSADQIVILASIVEREAVLPEERPLIAAVYLNRLKRRKPLEADPTVQYALGYWKKGLTLKDLQVDSPYNTYERFGLPPGPICSPGLGSVKAVLDPAPTKALYFVADNVTGGHVFNETYEEHLKAKEKARQERLRQKRAAKRR